MSRHPIYGLLPTDVEGFDSLAELALDMRWSWNHATDKVWRTLDPALWRLTQNPWLILQTVSRDLLERVLADPDFRESVEDLLEAERKSSTRQGWFQSAHPQNQVSCVAYFSMEFMLSEALPIYSGGLGNVAGDQLKAASDLGVPVIGVGLLYQQGYFRQTLNEDGTQEALYPFNDPDQLPILPLRKPSGDWLRLEVELPGRSIWLRAWEAKVGRAKLYLLDSNDPANLPVDRAKIGELYGGGPELRLQQEILLGLGGWRLLRALGIRPEVCHMNEGHAAFAALERAGDFMEDTGQPFAVALAATRVGNVFTTHTAVEAGFDRFLPSLIQRYLGDYAQRRLGLAAHELLALGRANPDDSSESFNMAYMAIRGSGSTNGVSRLHGRVSRELFEPLFQRWPLEQIPIGHVSNGVHVPSWESDEADLLWTEACGTDRWNGPMDALEKGLRGLPDSRLWKFRADARRLLVEYARARLSRQLATAGAPPEEVARARHVLDPEALTLGFARRFATYKRPNLLLHDPERLLRLLTTSERPVQLILAGKAHPDDRAGQELIKEWVNFVRRPEARAHAIFLSDYDVVLSERLVQGVDLWINTPRRPWEACGTSGMKVHRQRGDQPLGIGRLVGGGIHPRSRLGPGDGRGHADDSGWDGVEAASLYDHLESEVVPEFYARGHDGVPTAWVARMRESMARLTARYSAHRAVREYTEKHYLPAAIASRSRAADGGAESKDMLEWRGNLVEKWGKIRFGPMKYETSGKRYAFEVLVTLEDVGPESVRVELYAGAPEGGHPVLQEMKRVGNAATGNGGYLYAATVPAGRPASDYTARVIPSRPGVSVPLELDLILWQK